MKVQFQMLMRFLFYKAFGYLMSGPVLGVRITGREHLPSQGPAVLIANHNSHLDTLVLGSMLPLSALRLISPVAASKYFLGNRFLAWFATHILGITPVGGESSCDVRRSLRRCCEALGNGRILIFFPEGTRGEAEVPSRIKGGIAAIARQCPEVPVIPVRLTGLGHSLPKGRIIPLPLTCQAHVGVPIQWTGSKSTYLQSVKHALVANQAMPFYDELA